MCPFFSAFLKVSNFYRERSLVCFSDIGLPYAGYYYLFVCTIHYKNTQTSRTRSSSHCDAPPFDVIISIAHAMRTEDMTALFVNLKQKCGKNYNFKFNHGVKCRRLGHVTFFFRIF